MTFQKNCKSVQGFYKRFVLTYINYLNIYLPSFFFLHINVRWMGQIVNRLIDTLSKFRLHEKQCWCLLYRSSLYRTPRLRNSSCFIWRDITFRTKYIQICIIMKERANEEEIKKENRAIAYNNAEFDQYVYKTWPIFEAADLEKLFVFFLFFCWLEEVKLKILI